MKHLRWGYLCPVVFLACLAGCGSSAAPPYSLSCTQTRLAGGAIRAAVTVRNSTSASGNAYIFGPAFTWIRHIYPVLQPAQVVVEANHTQTSYPALTVSAIGPKRAAHLLIRFEHPTSPLSLAVAADHRIQAQDSSVLNNPDCTIGKSK